MTPVAVRKLTPRELPPWTVDALGESRPVILPVGELDIEQVAAQRPDLILATYSDIDQAEYEDLSRIAPVVARGAGYVEFGMPWQETTRIISRALWREDRGGALIDRIEARFAQARQEHPEFAKSTAVFAYRSGNGVDFGVYSSADPRGQFLTSLGFRYPTDIDELTGDQFSAAISSEQLGLLDRDVLVMAILGAPPSRPARDELLENPVYRGLAVVQDGRDVYSDELTTAVAASSPLSLPPAIDALVPQLARATAR